MALNMPLNNYRLKFSYEFFSSHVKFDQILIKSMMNEVCVLQNLFGSFTKQTPDVVHVRAGLM